MDKQYACVTQDDYLLVVRLVAEIATAEDSNTRWLLLISGIKDLVCGHAVLACLGRASGTQLELDATTARTAGGLDEPCVRRFLESGEYRRHPVIEPGLRRFSNAPWLAAAREEFFDDRQWHELPFVQSAGRGLDMGPTIYAALRTHADQSLFLAVSRSWNDACRFQDRDVQCVDLLMEVGHRLATLFHAGRNPESGLSSRLRQTLHGLLAGQSEKEIARELQVSTATVHHYVAELYRHFRVHSARELMAVLLPRRP